MNFSFLHYEKAKFGPQRIMVKVLMLASVIVHFKSCTLTVSEVRAKYSCYIAIKGNKN